MALDVDRAIDGDAAAEALAPHLPGLQRCTPCHAKYKPGPEALLFEAAAQARWSSLPFRALEPDWPAAMEQCLQLADRCLTAYRRRSATTAA